MSSVADRGRKSDDVIAREYQHHGEIEKTGVSQIDIGDASSFSQHSHAMPLLLS